MRCLQEIAGSIAATCPSAIDFKTPGLSLSIDIMKKEEGKARRVVIVDSIKKPKSFQK
jgi:hypothetical protein